MNKKRLLCFTLIMLIFSSAFVNAGNAADIIGDNFEETAGSGLVIRTYPAGAKVYIDGVERGLTPLAFDKMKSGDYRIKLVKEGYKERNFNVTLFNTSRLVVSIEMEELRSLALVTIRRAPDSPQSLPLNPVIYTGQVNEQAVALNADNSTILNLPVGYRTIRVRAFGWEEASVTLLITENVTAAADIYMKSSSLKIDKPAQSRKRFNPKNSGSSGKVEYYFDVSSPGNGTFTVLDPRGNEAYSVPLDQFKSWRQSISWDGRDASGGILPEGTYTIIIEASGLPEYSPNGNETARLEMRTVIDYSLVIFPLSQSGGVSGLSFAPLPNVLPAGSFQIDGGVYFGSFSSHDPKSIGNSQFVSLPFELALRLSPINRLELSAAFNAAPYFDGSFGWGLTSALKVNILNGFPLGFAAGISYAWASENGEAPLSPGRGAGLYLPFSCELKQFLLVASPGIFWRGMEAPLPLLLLSTGLMYRGQWFNTGLSLRGELDFNDFENLSRLLTGAEIRFYPPPANLVFSLQSGMWTRAGNFGGYCSLGIGVIY